MAVPDNYVSSLVRYAKPRGAAGKQKLLDLHETLFERIEKNQGKELVNSSINGKTFGFQVTMTVEEQFGAIGDALAELDPADADAKIVCTRADFRGLQL
jgi:hypothetical protein